MRAAAYITPELKTQQNMNRIASKSMEGRGGSLQRWLPTIVIGLSGLIAAPVALEAGVVIDEDFSSGAGDFTVVSGGTWSVSGGRYVLSSPATAGDGLLGNISVHDTSVAGDYVVSGTIRIIGTSALWNDAALIFGYQDSDNFYYVSLNENDDGYTKGVFKVVSGNPTEIYDLASLTVTTDTDYEVIVERSGSQIDVWVDSSNVASFSDSTFTGGQFGFGTKNDSAEFDDLIVEEPDSGIVDEDFSAGASDFDVIAGGTWSVSGGVYVLSSPAAASVDGTLGNISVHETVLNGDYTVSGDLYIVATSHAWNDAALVFGLQDSDNYYYVSLNESNNGTTHGIFKVVNGTPTELADFGSLAITAGNTYSVQVERSGSSITAYVNSAQAASINDSTFSGGQVGFGTVNDAAEFDNLYAEEISGGGTVAAPVFSPVPGSYGSAQNVTITSSTSGATIRYTTNGSTPTSSSGTVYTGAVYISSTTTLKAIAYKSGMSDSSVTSGTYTISGIPAKPGPSNTGTSGTLTTYTGSKTITVDNTVLEDYEMSGTIHIKANNVTIRNCKISGGIYSINCTYGYTGLLIEDCELINVSSAGVYGGNFTMRRTQIHESDGDAVKPTTNCLIEQCWFYNLGRGAGAHADGVQSRHGGTNMTFRYNNFDMPITAPSPYKSNAAFMLEPDGGPLTNVLIEYNWMNGGNYTIYSSGDTTIRNNWFGRDYRYGIRNGPYTEWSGNVWEDDGTPAP